MWKVETIKGFGLVIVWDEAEEYDFAILFLCWLFKYKSKDTDFNMQIR